MRRITLPLVLVLLASFALASPAVSQSTSDSLEREARSAFKARKFRDAAFKYHEAAVGAPEARRRGKMEVQAAWAHYNDGNQKAMRESLRLAVTADPNLEIVADFFTPEFVRAVEEIQRALRPTPAPPVPDLAELKRVSTEKLRDGNAAEVVVDLTAVPVERRDADLWILLAQAYETLGRSADAAAARGRALGGGPAPGPAPTAVATPAPTPALVPTPIPTPGPALRPPDPVDPLAAGRAAYDRGDAPTALAAANRALESDPNSAEAFRLLGDIYAMRSNKELALANWRQALRLDAKNEAALLTLADFFLAERDWEQALANLKAATELNAKNGAKLVALGRKARADGDAAHARQVFAAAASAQPSDVAVLTEYGLVLAEGGDLDAALEPLMKAAVEAPGNATARANLAAALRKKGQTREAEREYREALRADGRHLPALHGLGALLLAADRPKEAVELYAKAREKEPKRVEALVGLARAQRLSGDPEAAATSLAATKELDHAEVWNEAGVVAYERGRYAEAVACFDSALAKDAAFAPAKANRERAAAAAKFLAEAGVTP